MRVGSSAIAGIGSDSEVVRTEYFNLQGIRVDASYRGIAIKVVTLADGSCEASKVMLR